MPKIKQGTMVAFSLLLVTIIASACNQPYSQQPSVTNTPINAASLFETPINQTPGITMSDIANFGTSTALALTGTPVAGLETQTPSAAIDTQDPSVTVTPTALISTDPTFISTATLAMSDTLPTSVPVGSRPASYTLQRGEFPYCIARRFDVDPDALLSLNGLSSGNLYYPNLTLKIPQSGNFPGTRALRNHPATYTVAASNETLYGVACLFGDVDPSAIAQANNIAVGAALTAGQQLSIP
ncbi:MAG TPA: LysM peptidoglycan-binding domain-containing protein [Anaerolineales bacterium]|nr:LysM peptidoglycan-binding domain-containing protein [Anaerolineales bacterium]